VGWQDKEGIESESNTQEAAAAATAAPQTTIDAGGDTSLRSEMMVSTGSSLHSCEGRDHLQQQSSSEFQQNLQQYRRETADSEAGLFVIHQVDHNMSRNESVVTADEEESGDEEFGETQSSNMPSEVSSPAEEGQFFAKPPPPPPSSRRASNFSDQHHHIAIRSLYLEDMTAKVSMKRESFDQQHSHDDEVMVRLSLPEGLEIPADESVQTSGPEDGHFYLHSGPSGDHLQDPSFFPQMLHQRRASLPRTQEVINILTLESESSGNDNDEERGDRSSSQSLEEENSIATTMTLSCCADQLEGEEAIVAEGKEIPAQGPKSGSHHYHDHETLQQPVVIFDDDTREQMISSVSSFTTACSDVCADIETTSAAITKPIAKHKTEFDQFLLSTGLRAEIDSPFDENRTIPNDSNTCAMIQQPGSPVVPIGSHVSVKVSHVNTPSDFYLHISHKDSVEKLFNQIQLMQGRQGSRQRDPEIIIGMTYAIKSAPDASWSRVKVMDVFHDGSKNQGFAEVFFLDYGRTARVISDEIYHLESSLMQIPAQAIHCCLNAVNGPSNVWSLKAIEEFRNSVAYYSMRAVFHEDTLCKSSCDKKYPVDLFLDWGGDQVMNNVLLYLSPTEFISSQSYDHS
jgi:hypothetical protein